MQLQLCTCIDVLQIHILNVVDKRNHIIILSLKYPNVSISSVFVYMHCEICNMELVLYLDIETHAHIMILQFQCFTKHIQVND